MKYSFDTPLRYLIISTNPQGALVSCVFSSMPHSLPLTPTHKEGALKNYFFSGVAVPMFHREVVASVFQKFVWDYLCTILHGHTVTY